jgi:hypothetical protein
MSAYRVLWTCDVEASSPANAASAALRMMRDPEEDVGQFLVKQANSSGEMKLVRLGKEATHA